MSREPSALGIALSSTHLFIGLILLGIGGVFFTVSWSVFLEERAYRNGPHADAEVIAKHMRPATDEAGTAYELTLAVRTPDGDVWRRTTEVDAALWDSVAEGGHVPVQYRDGDPGSVRPVESGVQVPVAIAAALAAPVALLGLWLTGRGVRDTARRLRVARHGPAVPATVTRVRETNLSVNRRPQWAIDFTFRDRAGEIREGSSAPMAAWRAHEWKVGDTGMVRYDPARPGVHVWVGERDEDEEPQAPPARGS